MLLLSVLAVVFGCQHDTTPPPTTLPPADPEIFLSPQNATLTAGSTLQLSATVSDWKMDSTVTWTIACATAGVTQLGSINVIGGTATYTAPVTVVSPLSLQIKARSNEDTTEFAVCAITVNPLQQGPVRTRISVSPVTVSMQPGGTQQFQASVTGPANTGVRWVMVSGPGSLSSSGLYASPMTIPGQSSTAIIEAISLADTTAIAVASISIQIPAPCFRTMVFPILISHCTIQGCHNPTDFTHGIDLTTYAGVMALVTPGDTANSVLSQRLDHFQTLPDSDVSVIKEWILSGAQNTTCEPNMADCDTANIHYSNYVAPAIATYCLGCHSQRNAGLFCDSIDFSTYNEVALMAQTGALMNVIQHTPPLPVMPEYGPQLDACTIAKIAAWVSNGAPND